MVLSTLDEKDIIIVSRIAEHPDLSQAELAAAVGMSQPSVNARIHKLKAKGVIATKVGVELEKTGMTLVRVDFAANNAEEILNKMKDCSFFVNGFIMSGKLNASIFIVGTTLKKIEHIIDRHLRVNDEIKDIEMNVVVGTSKPYICSVNFAQSRKRECGTKDCTTCMLC